MSAIIVYMLTFIGICSVFGIFLMIQGFCSWFLKPNETQMELPITSTNNRRMSYVPSAPPFTARHFIVELPEEVEDSNPPAYSNFSPPSYEETKTICHLCGTLLNDYNKDFSSNMHHCNSCHIRDHFENAKSEWYDYLDAMQDE